MKSFKEEIKNAIIEATASDKIVSFKAIANEYGHSHMKSRDVEDIKAAVLKAVPDFRAVMMYDNAEQMAHPERQSLFCGLHFVENGVEFETWSVHFPTPAKSSAKENSYEWKKLMRKTKEQLLAEAQRLGSTVDSLTTRSKADLADYVIWLADREKTLTEEEQTLVDEYTEKTDAIVDRFCGGWVISDYSDSTRYATKAELMAAIRYNLEQMAEDSSALIEYEVDRYDYETGATEAIDTIKAPEGYTAEDYINDCESNADEDWNDMLRSGRITLVEI
jgi:hypothetical protein